MPSTWTRWIDDDGEEYYWNYQTNEYSFETVEECTWFQEHDDDGNPYWVDTVTGKSQWEPPSGGCPVDPVYLSTIHYLQREIHRMSAIARVVPVPPQNSENVPVAVAIGAP